MSKPQDRMVYRRADGNWVNKLVDSDRATSLHDTQAYSIAAATSNLGNAGGGELTIMGRNGQIRRKTTIPAGNDPYPPRDK